MKHLREIQPILHSYSMIDQKQLLKLATPIFTRVTTHIIFSLAKRKSNICCYRVALILALAPIEREKKNIE